MTNRKKIMASWDKLTMGIKTVFASFLTVGMMSMGYANLSNSDKSLNKRFDKFEIRTEKEIGRLDRRVDLSSKDYKELQTTMNTVVTDVAVIKDGQAVQIKILQGILEKLLEKDK